MSTIRSLKRQSMYGHRWKNRGRNMWLHPEKLTVRQKLYLTLMSTMLGRGILRTSNLSRRNRHERDLDSDNDAARCGQCVA